MRYYAGELGWKFEDEMEPFEWTSEPPTQEGWYWAFYKGVVFVHVIEDDGKLWISGDGWDFPLSNYTHWLGPVPVPEPPTKGE